MKTEIKIRAVSRSVVVYDPPGEGLPALAVALNGANAVYVEAFATVELAEDATTDVYQAAFGGHSAPADDDADLLYGVKAIAGFLGLTVKQAEHRVADGSLPTFKLGGKARGTVCASKKALAAHMAALMAAATPSAHPEGGEHGRRI